MPCCFEFFFFFKQKTAYEMRISDWSSDVCSSDLVARRQGVPFEGIWLEASPDLLKQRITARANDASDADAAVAEAQAHYDIGGVDWHKVRADGAREVVAGKVRTILVGEDR